MMAHCWDVELMGTWLKKFTSGSIPLKISLGTIDNPERYIQCMKTIGMHRH